MLARFQIMVTLLARKMAKWEGLFRKLMICKTLLLLFDFFCFNLFDCIGLVKNNV